MPTVGYTTAPSANSDFGTFAGQQAATSFTMPSTGGLITDLHVHVATDNGSSNGGFLCLWDSGGTLLAHVSVTIPSSEGWVTGTLGTPYFMTGSTTFFIGAQINSSSTVGLQAHYDSHSGSNVDFAHNGTLPGNLANITQFTSSAMGAYADYQVGAWVWNGSAWVNGVVQVFDGSSWNPGALGIQVFSGSSWVTGS